MKSFNSYQPYLRFAVICAILFRLANVVGAQTSISGKVTDGKTGQPLQGVSVTVAGFNKGTGSGDDGRYTLKPREAATSV